MNDTTIDGFTTRHVDVGETRTLVSSGGAGSPLLLLLLHGFPETHVMWRQVGPWLADRFTVVCADLRGYGGGGGPASDAEHAPYSKRAICEEYRAAAGIDRM